jgi:hypothetical protein
MQLPVNSDSLSRLAKATTVVIVLASAGLTVWVWSLPNSLFEKLDEHGARSSERVSTWRINWA